MVKIVPKFYFNDIIVPNICDYKDTFFISILDPDEEYSKFEPFFEDSSNYITFKFVDIDKPIGYKWLDDNIFTEKMADDMIDFILSNKHMKHCIVHCSAGVSRSGAVGEFINDIFKYKSYIEFKRDNPNICPNLLVKKLLNDSYNKKT